MFWSDNDYTGNGTAGWDYDNDAGTACATTWYIRDHDSSWRIDPSISFDLKTLLAIAAAEKDRLHWTFKVVLFWLWTYIPAVILTVLRLMFSLSGWLARVGKKRKSGK